MKKTLLFITILSLLVACRDSAEITVDVSMEQKLGVRSVEEAMQSATNFLNASFLFNVLDPNSAKEYDDKAFDNTGAPSYQGKTPSFLLYKAYY